IILQSSFSQPQKIQKPRKPTRKVIEVPQPSDPMEHVTDEAVHKELGDSLVRNATTASSLEAEQDSENEEILGEDASKQGRRIDDIDVDEDITLVNVQDDVEMFDADKDLGGEEVFVKQEVADKEKIDEVTLAQALAELKISKPKVKGVVIQEPKEPMKPMKKEQIRLDEEVALKLQAEFTEEERLARERAQKEQEANIALIET
nr:hypothetical protein [Tanacetum cinerariifolium]